MLLDYYSNLLSDRQKEYLLEHFEGDLSLTEIGKKYNITRQAVYDNIRRGIKILRDYEEKIGFYKRDVELLKQLNNLKKNFKIEKLEEIIEKNF
ncbi:MAG: YlxM family DNA-binding protein [Cetobacterium sp.]